MWGDRDKARGECQLRRAESQTRGWAWKGEGPFALEGPTAAQEGGDG